MYELDERKMVFWVAEYNGSRHWKTARGSASACWGVLCGENESDPLELEAFGWRVIKCVATAVERDLRFHAVAFGEVQNEPQPSDPSSQE